LPGCESRGQSRQVRDKKALASNGGSFFHLLVVLFVRAVSCDRADVSLGSPRSNKRLKSAGRMHLARATVSRTRRRTPRALSLPLSLPPSLSLSLSLSLSFVFSIYLSQVVPLVRGNNCVRGIVIECRDEGTAKEGS
jgi:hypothetical protein